MRQRLLNFWFIKFSLTLWSYWNFPLSFYLINKVLIGNEFWLWFCFLMFLFEWASPCFKIFGSMSYSIAIDLLARILVYLSSCKLLYVLFSNQTLDWCFNTVKKVAIRCFLSLIADLVTWCLNTVKRVLKHSYTSTPPLVIE